MAKHRRATGKRVAQRTTKAARQTGKPSAQAAMRAEVQAPTERREAAPPPAPPRKPTFYEAIALYETGVRALQKHDFDGAANSFRAVVQRYPEERELLERARLYLRVCERETAQRPAGPQSAQERVYAATMALNAGDSETALSHLQRAIDQDPNSDHAHYILAVALSVGTRKDDALRHLRRAVELNPENRALALQDEDLEALRDHEEFRSVLDTPPNDAQKRRPRNRR